MITPAPLVLSDSSAASRDALTTRVLPQMTLSTGGPESLTAAPAPQPSDISASERAALRFSVHGNAIVTGGAGTLALEAGLALLEHGLAGLALLDISPSQAEPAIQKLTEDFPHAKILGLTVDVTDPVSVKEAMASAKKQLGSIDILCCFAGVVSCLPSVDLKPEEWKRVLDINTTGAWFCAQEAAKHMISQSTGGSILFVASISAHRVNFPQPQLSYNVSKAALLHLKNSLAAEWARYGIRVNSISPGYMDTILNEGPGLKEARDIWASRNPMGRMGTPQELTGVVVLLCGRAGSYVNGADIVVDGGAIVF